MAQGTNGAPVNLGVGDQLTVQVKFTAQNINATNNFADLRFGVFDSKGTRTPTDLTGGQNHVSFGDDTGYAAQYFASGTGSPFVLYRRDVVSPTPITNPFNSFGSAGFTAFSATAPVEFTTPLPSIVYDPNEW